MIGNAKYTVYSHSGEILFTAKMIDRFYILKDIVIKTAPTSVAHVTAAKTETEETSEISENDEPADGSPGEKAEARETARLLIEMS